ncbi:HigA family addiction module antitoxin [Pelistega suis]|uniref:HigA family addiction module antitoxin n=1 Tax=Pelistega suis TaxID=1631957 RepID=UPI00211C4DBB|nr:HigA family addiction module antitoxin [Pelistega suis]MCQ9328911.1 HigA family addiction module antitoxin [Pelistega suis]
MLMHNPPPPCDILREDVLPGLNMTVTEFARHLGYSREAMSRTLHGKTPITAQMAWRLEQAGISTAEMWLNLQIKYDLWQLKHQKSDINIQPIKILELA